MNAWTRAPFRRISLLAVGFAALAAACGGGTESPQTQQPPAQDGEIRVEAGDDLKFRPDTIAVADGEFTITLVNTGITEHDFLIRDVDDVHGEHMLHVEGGETASRDYELEAGSYEFYCSIPGHEEAGMVGTLTVG